MINQLAASRIAAKKPDYTLSLSDLQNIRRGVLKDVTIGVRTEGRDSSCKMLPSRVRKLPNGSEKGVYYAIDWGGSNVRFIRVKLSRNDKPNIDFVKLKIPRHLRTTDDVTQLFDFLAQEFKNHMIKHNEYQSNKVFSVGFTFSFPVKVPELNKGILVQWSKGFNINGVIGKDIAGLMNDAFGRYNCPARIDAICNDTVGTLISCSYDHPNTKIGIIIGTGCNAAYYEKDIDEVINTEWGNFDQNQEYLVKLPDTDIVMDEYTPNKGLFNAEKMISGMYCGEIMRILMCQVFKEKMPSSNSVLFDKFGEFGGLAVTILLRHYYNENKFYGTKKMLEILHSKEYNLMQFDETDIEPMVALWTMVLNRSADIAACMMLGVLEKVGLFKEVRRNVFELADRYKNDVVTVGIDGGVFLNMPQYPQRIRKAMVRMVGVKIVNRVNVVHAEDGSGRGAALCVAAVHRDDHIQSKL